VNDLWFSPAVSSCSKCGKRMQFKHREIKNGGYWTVICSYTYQMVQTASKLDANLKNGLMNLKIYGLMRSIRVNKIEHLNY